MTHVDRPTDDRDDDFHIDVLKTVEQRGRRLLLVALAAAALVTAYVALRYSRQPAVRTAALEFQPTFASAATGEYPNGMPFAVSDITASSIIDPVFDKNGVEQYCDRGTFKAGFFVEQHSTEYGLLEAEYQSRFADPRLTTVDGERLQAEYRARRASIPLQFRLVFSAVGPCQRIPATLMAKNLADVLAGWAEQSETRRGVLKQQVPVLTPSVLDVGMASEGSRLIRADLIRSALRRLIANIRDVETKPGANLVRAGDTKTTLAEVRAKFEDLIQARLDPLVVMAGRGLGPESVAWVEEALASATQEQSISEGKVAAYRAALREYSGTTASAAPNPPTLGQRTPTTVPGEIQTQIDRSFIDRILDMSQANTSFRQDLTRGMVSADVASADSRAKVAYYQHLRDSLRRPAGGSLTAAEVDAKLEEIVRDGKVLAAQFNALYEEWSAVSLRPAGGMYRANQPVRDQTIRTGTRRPLWLVALAIFAITLIGALLLFVLRDNYSQWRMRRLARFRA